MKADRKAEIWLSVLGALFLGILYLLNSRLTFQSAHSLMHGGIAYQILNGNLPPEEPLLAGHVLRYPWGGHLLAALVSRLLGITPLHSFAVLNVISIGFAVLLVFRISRLLIRDRLANSLSAFVSMFAVTVPYFKVAGWIGSGVNMEIRGIPAFKKFVNINCAPLGLVFFLLFVLSATGFLSGGRKGLNALGMAAGVLGCGFFYPPFLPGLVAGLAVACLASLVFRGIFTGRAGLRAVLAALGITAISCLVLVPYLRSISGGVAGAVDLFSPRYMMENTIRYLAVTVPLLVVIYLARKALRTWLDRAPAVILWSVIAANAAGYIFVHHPPDNEYKFLMLSVLCLGIVGGAAFAFALRRLNRVVVIGVLIVFALPGVMYVDRKSVGSGDLGFEPSAGGVDLDATDPEARELYAYIRENTPASGVFIDTELELPVLARRKLYVPWRNESGRRVKGYGQIELILGLQSGYGTSLLSARREAAERIYSGDRTGIAKVREDLAGFGGEVYVVARSARDMRGLDTAGLEMVFTAPEGTLALYRFPLPGS